MQYHPSGGCRILTSGTRGGTMKGEVMPLLEIIYSKTLGAICFLKLNNMSTKIWIGLTWLTATQINLDQIRTTKITLNQILIFYMAYYHGIVVHLLLENKNLLIRKNSPPTLHRLLRKSRQTHHQKLASHLWKILRFPTTHLVQYQTHKMTLIPIKIKIHQIILHRNHLIRRTPGTLNAKTYK